MNSHSEIHSTSKGIALLEFKEFRSLLRSVYATHHAGDCGSKNERASNVNNQVEHSGSNDANKKRGDHTKKWLDHLVQA